MYCITNLLLLLFVTIASHVYIYIIIFKKNGYYNNDGELYVLLLFLVYCHY